MIIPLADQATTDHNGSLPQKTLYRNGQKTVRYHNIVQLNHHHLQLTRRRHSTENECGMKVCLRAYIGTDGTTWQERTL